MAAAIPRVFILALHKLCRWHMIKKFREPLGLLYKLHPSFKVEFNAVLNWHLMPSEFEVAWKDLVEKYNLQDNNVRMQLWD